MPLIESVPSNPCEHPPKGPIVMYQGANCGEQQGVQEQRIQQEFCLVHIPQRLHSAKGHPFGPIAICINVQAVGCSANVPAIQSTMRPLSPESCGARLPGMMGRGNKCNFRPRSSTEVISDPDQIYSQGPRPNKGTVPASRSSLQTHNGNRSPTPTPNELPRPFSLLGVRHSLEASVISRTNAF